jgi:hypothetical protein
MPIGQGHPVTIENFAFGFAISMVAALILAFFAQLPRIGAWFAHQIGGKPGTAISYLYESVVEVTIFLIGLDLVMTIAMTGIETIGGLSWFDRWWLMNIQFWGIAFVAFLAARPAAEGLATRITSGKAKKDIAEN